MLCRPCVAATQIRPPGHSDETTAGEPTATGRQADVDPFPSPFQILALSALHPPVNRVVLPCRLHQDPRISPPPPALRIRWRREVSSSPLLLRLFLPLPVSRVALLRPRIAPDRLVIVFALYKEENGKICISHSHLCASLLDICFCHSKLLR